MMNDIDYVENFENHFFSLMPEKFYGKNIALAVSGGADSVALFECCLHLQKKCAFNLFVITVNHMIRKKSESEGDCFFVKELCEKNSVYCEIVNANENEIFELSQTREKGVEEAARFFRYSAFEKFAKEKKCDYVFLAHNKNDQLETLLQRFLQGSFSNSLSGIPKMRGIFYRPLLDFSRAEIEKYLNALGMEYRTDKTNFDSSYFRNRIRNRLMPLLNSEFENWQASVLHGKEKNELDNEYFESVLKDFSWKKEKNGFNFEKNQFEKMHLAVKIRFVYKILEKVKSENRISYENIKKFCLGKNVSTCGIRMEWGKEKVFVNPQKKCGNNIEIFAIIEEIGHYSFDFADVSVSEKKLSKENFSVSLPFSLEIQDGKIKIEELTMSQTKFSVFVGIKNE